MRWLLFLLAAGCGSDAKTCRLDGKWSGSPINGRFVGQRVTQYFQAGGDYEIDLNEAPFYGKWSVDGERLTISDDSSCQSAPPAHYELTFYGCDMAIYAIVDDSCMGRSTTLNGMSITRVPGG